MTVTPAISVFDVYEGINLIKIVQDSYSRSGFRAARRFGFDFNEIFSTNSTVFLPDSNLASSAKHYEQHKLALATNIDESRAEYRMYITNLARMMMC